MTGHRFSRRALLTGLGALAAAGGIAGIVDLGRTALSNPDDASRQLQIGYLPITDAAPLLIAHAAGLYDSAVSASQPVLFRSWASLAEAFVTRKVDIVHLLMPMAVQLRYSLGSSVRILGWNHTNGSALTVAPDIVELEQLAGRQVAIPFWWSIHNIVLQRLFRSRDLTPVVRQSASKTARTVELIVMSPSDMVPALANRSIGGYVVADPFNAAAQIGGIGRIHTFLGDVWRDHACCAVLVHQRLIDERPNDVQALANSVVGAQLRIDADRTAAATTLADAYLPQTKPAITTALTYDPAEFELRHPEWQPQRLGFDGFPYPSFTERLVQEMGETVVDGDRRFLDRLDPSAVHADLVDDRFFTRALRRHADPQPLGSSVEFSRVEELQP